MIKIALIYLIIFSISIFAFANNPSDQKDLQKWFHAIRIKKSGDRHLSPYKDTNGVIILGAYSISQGFFDDAKEFDKTINGEWEDCINSNKLCEQVILSYTRRYNHNNDTNRKAMCRLLNGGPHGCDKKSTLEYWEDVQRIYKGLK